MKVECVHDVNQSADTFFVITESSDISFICLKYTYPYEIVLELHISPKTYHSH